MKRTTGVALMLAMVGAVGVGCGLQVQSPAQQAVDFATAESCIQSHWGEPIMQLAGDCLNGELAATEDIVADLEALFGSSDAGALAATYSDNPAVAERLRAKKAAK